jgi:hypothetical protein
MAQPVAVPRWQRLQQEDALEQCHVITDRRPAELERSGQVGHIEEPGRLSSREGQETWQHVERADTGQIAHVALDQGLDVVAVPRRAPPCRRPRQRRGVATGHDALDELRAEPPAGPGREGVSEQRVQEARRRCAELALSQRMEAQDLHPPCERIGELRHEQNIG